MEYLANLAHLFTVLDPAGVIGSQEKMLMIQATLFMLIVAVPVWAAAIFFAWWYRASNTTARYQPDWAHSNAEELIWWAIPIEIILVLGAFTWTSTHELDPRRPIGTDTPLVVEVVALDWKWLFIYPEQGIATVNYAEIPVGKPVVFKITADAPMNSFWVPRLGGQIYAMTGMVNELNLRADEAGSFTGMSANYSGIGFNHMNFTLRAVEKERFDAWVLRTRDEPRTLDRVSYATLRKQSIETKPVLYGSVMSGLYETILGQFMPGMSGYDAKVPMSDMAHSM